VCDWRRMLFSVPSWRRLWPSSRYRRDRGGCLGYSGFSARGPIHKLVCRKAGVKTAQEVQVGAHLAANGGRLRPGSRYRRDRGGRLGQSGFSARGSKHQLVCGKAGVKTAQEVQVSAHLTTNGGRRGPSAETDGHRIPRGTAGIFGIKLKLRTAPAGQLWVWSRMFACLHAKGRRAGGCMYTTVAAAAGRRRPRWHCRFPLRRCTSGHRWRGGRPLYGLMSPHASRPAPSQRQVGAAVRQPRRLDVAFQNEFSRDPRSVPRHGTVRRRPGSRTGCRRRSLIGRF
jgi:hypothetical protein